MAVSTWFNRNLVVGVILLSVASAIEFPAAKIPRCNYGDVHCIRKSAEYILTTHKDGIPELNVPSLDPVAVSEIKIENPGIVNIDLILKDGKMIGFSKSKVMNIKGFSMEFDPAEHNEVEVFVPNLQLISPYIIDGKVFLFPIKGSGNTNFTFENITLKFKFRSKPITRGGDDKWYFRSTDMKLNLTADKLYLNFDNLFNGDKFLCEQTNNLLNRRSDDILRELKSRVEASFESEISARVDEAFSKFHYSDYFLPGPIPKSKVSPELFVDAIAGKSFDDPAPKSGDITPSAAQPEDDTPKKEAVDGQKDEKVESSN